VVFAVPEDKVALIQTGSAVDVRAWNDNLVVKGVIREVAASTDPVTRTYAVKVALTGKETLPLGSTVTVLPKSLSRGGTPVLKIPTSALHQDGRKAAVWVLDMVSMTVNLVPISLATADGNEVVVSAGLKAGDRVVSAGVHVLSPGQKVTLFKEKVPPGPVGTAPAAIDSVASVVVPATSKPTK
jgi:RND family efflux transporter MFP subunit